MAIFQTYSKIKKGMPDIYVYDNIPEGLRNQIYHICWEFLNQERVPIHLREECSQEIYKTIVKEHRLKELPYHPFAITYDHFKLVFDYFETLRDTDAVLDVIHIVFSWFEALDLTLKKQYITKLLPTLNDCIEELNIRFRENGVGYEYVNGYIIRIDNSYLHDQTVKDTLILVSESGYKDVNDEYIVGLDHFRHGRKEDCLNWCGKAFESVMKIVCNKNGWAYNEKDTASPLINILLKRDFLPGYQQNMLSGIRQFLESSIPTIRNKNLAAHSKVPNPSVSSHVEDVPESIVRYMIYITGASIRLIIETQKERERTK